MVNHNNSLENFMLFALSLIFSFMMAVPEKEVRVAAAFYFVMRCVPQLTILYENVFASPPRL
jgi:uncharacterized MAPEG superfamily protein